MGLDESLKLLDLPPDATIDDAEKAFTHMQNLIEQYYQDADGDVSPSRQADLELLSLAYEKALVHISERDFAADSKPAPKTESVQVPRTDSRPMLKIVSDLPELEDLDESMDFSDEQVPERGSDSLPVLPESDIQTVEAALAIISRRLHEAEAALPEAQQVVDQATAAVDAANRRHERVRQESINAIVVAKSAKIRALLLEIESKRAVEKAMAVAEKARERVTVAKRMAKAAMAEAEKAQQEVGTLKESEEAAAADAVNAESQLEQAKARLKTLTNRLVETRQRMRISRDSGGMLTLGPGGKINGDSLDAVLADQLIRTDVDSGASDDRNKLISDLLEIEASLQNGDGGENMLPATNSSLAPVQSHIPERRRQARIVYPPHQRPGLSVEGRTLPILDLSVTGMRLETGDGFSCPRILRGEIRFTGRQPVKVTGKVVREDDRSAGLRLVTRIGNHILDKERLRLSA
ncbi:hypothetical protein DSCO28_05150 [Desulfosarcina ovata subsp. sediminis]|uniref:PilZ domain-containing protein n=3 Tax=Desulfosarcina ovata TaxID=83564 RepID=A0A5K8A3T5_9BACT|nr:hypothetical protein DSCO28_05150 [Desulfosarcina ovata subsp. sediminis]BBO87253.1 hypothetical protein DSCOOX_04330 [Desulfosarcina ovata subsp. ovata]